jgi:hypothetical protein
MWRIPCHATATERHVQETLMTEKELLQQIAYHKHHKDHHEKIIQHYENRVRLLRKAIATQTSQEITNNIIERLKN